LTLFVNVTATPVISTLSLHDALPIFLWREIDTRPICPRRKNCPNDSCAAAHPPPPGPALPRRDGPRQSRWRSPNRRRSTAPPPRDRKSTRLNSSHVKISYAVFCLKKK